MRSQRPIVVWVLSLGLLATGCATVIVDDDDSIHLAQRERLEAAMKSPRSFSLEERQSLLQSSQVSGMVGEWYQDGIRRSVDGIAERAQAWQMPEVASALTESQALKIEPSYYFIDHIVGLAVSGGAAYLGGAAVMGSVHDLGSAIVYPMLLLPAGLGLIASGYVGGEYLSRWIEGSARQKRLDRSLDLEKEGMGALNEALRQRLELPKSPSEQSFPGLPNP